MSILPVNTASDYKKKVAARFSKAAHTYDDYAAFQTTVVGKLFSMAQVSQSNELWLDLGTGTGQALPLLNSLPLSPHLIAADLSLSMLGQVKAKRSEAQLVCADAEQLPFKNESFDGIFSSLALQWCLNLEVLFSELYRVNKPEGSVIFATLLDESMPELSKAWKDVDGLSHQNHYVSSKVLLDACETAGFDIEEARCESITTWYPSVREVVYSLKKVGASFISDGAPPISPGKWRKFEAAYEQNREARGLPLSYRVAFIHLKKVKHG